jgi:hypothetical protein
MSYPLVPHAKTAGPPAPALLDRREGAGKIALRLKPRNPLKSLDSDERIQENPRQSNPWAGGPSQRNGHEPRESKRDTRALKR